MSSWGSAAVTVFVTQDDIRDAQLDDENDTPILKLLADGRDNGYETLCVPLTTDKWRDRWRRMCLLPNDDDQKERGSDAERMAEEWREKPAFFREEVNFTRLEEASSVIVTASDWLELDTEDDWLRHDFEIALQQELAYAAYLNVQTVILPPPRDRSHVASYARAINACLATTSYVQLSLRLPIYDPTVFKPRSTPPSSDSPPLPASPSLSISSSASFPTSLTASPSAFISLPSALERAQLKDPSVSRAQEVELNGNWEMWDVIRTICDYNPRLSLTLDLTPPLPSTPGILGRWAAEPLRHVFIPTSSFIANAKGYPVLPKGTQDFLRDVMKHQPTVILSGVKAKLHSKGGEGAYAQYIRHLEKTSLAIKAINTPGTVENFAQGYQDYLQAPLQPLMDNLQSVTYQTFEQDPVKYHKYEEAVYKALLEWPSQETVIICVAGAGRGPLVARCIAAAERAKHEITLYAIEKNPNAYVTLQQRLSSEWSDNVTLFYGDMRSVELPAKVDIVVSELLGSFGDNELSPECLDGAQRFLKPNGISIPASYTAHLAPLSSFKLLNEARANKEPKNLETPYVVMFQAINILSGNGGGLGGRCGARFQECWEFEHPRRDVALDHRGLPLTNSHNVRSARMVFHIPHAGVLHGFAGYFEAVLYGDVGLSIHPDRKDSVSKDMLSWFPLFFPLKEQLYLPSNSELQVSIWRLTNRRQVWYEWFAEAFMPVSYASLSSSTDRVPTLSSMPALGGRRPSSLFPSSPSAPVAAPSPMIDAVDAFPLLDRNASDSRSNSKESTTVKGDGVVKIGQTSLHNPGSRSSWIGL